MRSILKQKKGVMGPIISVFVMVLVISILAGLTFLFTSLGVGALGTVDTAFLAPTIGITLISGVIIFGVPYYLINKFFHTNTRR